MISEERRERFWEALCGLYGIMWVGFALTVSLFVLSVLSYLYVDRTTGSYTIVRVNLIILTALLIAILIPLRRCSGR